MLTVSAATCLYILHKSILVQPVVVKAGSLWNPITRAKNAVLSVRPVLDLHLTV